MHAARPTHLGRLIAMGAAMLLTVLWAAAQGEQVQRTLGQILLSSAAYAGATLTLLGLLWWLVWPRIRAGIEGIAKQVQETHKSVTVNGGKSSPPTLLDKVHQLSGQVDQLIVVSGANAQRASDLAERVDDVHDIAEEARDLSRETRDQFREHEQRGERYLGEVRLVLGKSGIELPPAND